MHLNHLVLRNFRNYVDCEIDFPNRVNLITGGNAQGKTSLLEAIYFLSTAKSHRAYPNDELIRHNESWFYLKGIIATDIKRNNPSTDLMTLEVSSQLQGQKRFKLNGDLQQRLSQWMGQFKVVFFSPESLFLVKGTPADRRRFIDLLICQIHAVYLVQLQDYQSALKQRNELLKQIRSNQASSDMLEAWNGLLVDNGISIIQTRSQILSRLQAFAREKHAALTGNSEQLELKYHPLPALEGLDVMDRSDAITRFRKALEDSRRDDILRGTTSIGPHRDDIKLLLETKKQGVMFREEAKPYASQGQQRTVALTLKLSELEVIHQTTGTPPIVLLDDVISELDENRTAFLLDLLQRLNAQTFITATQQGVLPGELPDCSVLTVDDGTVG